MIRFSLSLAAAFLAGALAGALAMAGRGPDAGPGEAPPAEPAVAEREAAGAVASAEPRVRDDPGDPAALSAVTAEPAPRPSGPSEDPSALRDRVRELTASWTRMQEELIRLQGRVSGLERQLSARSAAADPQRPQRPDTPERRTSVLIEAGVTEDLAADIVWREGQYELDRLELRHNAIREGWFRTDRYREEVSRLEEERPDLRAELGDAVYDRYLYAAGEDNRVRVDSVIPGSVAEAAGLQPGDLIETYDGGRVFTFDALRGATAEGERGETVAVEIRRADGSRVQAWVPRGPLGVRLDLARTDPDA
jgi:hypothetical protein